MKEKVIINGGKKLKEKVIIFGSGGQGKVVAQVLEAAGAEILGFIDDNRRTWGKKVLGYPVLGGKDKLSELEKCGFIIGIGDNRVRKELYQTLLAMGFTPATAIDPSARIHRSVQIGRGTVVLPGVVINADTQIGENCILNTTASIDHDCLIGEHTHIAPNCSLGGGVAVGDITLVGIGSTVLPGIRIGSSVIVGGGSVVVKYLPDGVTAFGVPAKSR